MDATLQRCPRCGTIIRNNRLECPSCGTDLVTETEEPKAQPLAADAVTAPVTTPTPAAPVKKTICQACMASVPETEIVEYKGGRICPKCAEQLMNKAQRKNT